MHAPATRSCGAFGEHYVFTARETVFWQNSEGFGTTTRMYLDRAISDTLLLRWANLGKYTEETIGLEWYTQLTLFQSLNERTGLAWQLQTEGETDNEVQLTRHSARLILRRQLTCGLAVPRAARRRLLAAPQAHRRSRSEP